MMWHARQEDLITTESGEDLLVYDQKRQAIHHLEPLAARVWRACDGQRTTADLAALTQTSPGAIGVILNQLNDAELFKHTNAPGEASRLSRRKALATAGVGAAVISVSAPAAVAAMSTGDARCWFQGCNEDDEGEIVCSWFATDDSYADCQSLDACYPGGGSPEFDLCYKWTVGPDDPFEGW